MPLKWTPNDTQYENNSQEGNRWARRCSLYYDGTLLHALVGYCKSSVTTDIVRLVLESYSIDGNKMILEEEVSLVEEDDKFYLLDEKSDNYEEQVAQSNIVTNGEYLVVMNRSYAYFFDQATGKFM